MSVSERERERERRGGSQREREKEKERGKRRQPEREKERERERERLSVSEREREREREIEVRVCVYACPTDTHIHIIYALYILGSDRNFGSVRFGIRLVLAGSVRQKFCRTFAEFFSIQFHAHLQYTGIILCSKSFFQSEHMIMPHYISRQLRFTL